MLESHVFTRIRQFYSCSKRNPQSKNSHISNFKKRTSSHLERQPKAVKKACEDQVGDNWSMFTFIKQKTWTDGSLLAQQHLIHIISLACSQDSHEFFMNQQDILIFWLLPPLPSHWISFAHSFLLVSFIDALENAKGFCRDLYPFSLLLLTPCWTHPYLSLWLESYERDDGESHYSFLSWTRWVPCVICIRLISFTKKAC